MSTVPETEVMHLAVTTTASCDDDLFAVGFPLSVYSAEAIPDDHVTSFSFPDEVERPEVVRLFNEADGSRCTMNSDMCDQFTCSGGKYTLPYRGPEVLPVTPESSPSSTPDLQSTASGFSFFPASTAVGTMPPFFAAFPPQFPPVSAYNAYAESGFVTPAMSPINGRQLTSPPNVFPFLPSCYVTWPNTSSFHSIAPTCVDVSMQQRQALTTEKYANQTTGSYFRHENRTGSRNGDGSHASYDFPGISFCMRQEMGHELPLFSGIPEMTSRPSYCDVVAERDCNSIQYLLPVRPPAPGCCNYRQIPPSCDVLPWYLRFPECSQFDSDLSVADVEPEELDQYLDRKSVSPCFDISETTRTANCIDPLSEHRINDEIALEPPSVISPEAVLRLCKRKTGSSFFFDEDANSRLGNLSSITSAEGQTNPDSNVIMAATCSTTTDVARTGSRYSNPNDRKEELCHTSTSPRERLLSEDEAVPIKFSVSEADEEQRETYSMSIQDMLNSPLSNFVDYTSVADSAVTSPLLV